MARPRQRTPSPCWPPCGAPRSTALSVRPTRAARWSGPPTLHADLPAETATPTPPLATQTRPRASCCLARTSRPTCRYATSSAASKSSTGPHARRPCRRPCSSPCAAPGTVWRGHWGWHRASAAAKAIKRRLQHKNPNVQLLALKVRTAPASGQMPSRLTPPLARVPRACSASCWRCA